MRLDELVDKYNAKDNCNLCDVLKSKECKHLFAATSNSFGGLLIFLIEHPECICQVKIKQENPNILYLIENQNKKDLRIHFSYL
jgi:hypothetical protein